MANLSNINNKFLVTTGGDVGVGITSPVEKLDTLNIAIGGATITSYSPNKLRIDNNGGNSRFYSTGANTTTTGSYQIHVTSSDGSINNPALTIASDTNATFAGNVNISSPGDLYINSGTSYNNVGSVFMSNQRTEISSIIVDGTAQGDTALNFKTRSAGSTASAMFINEFRRVGIGTDDPLQKLQVNGQVLFRTTTVDGGKNRFQFIPGGSSDAANLYLYYGNSGDGTVSVRINAQGDSYFNGGDVGIGVTSPGQKLHVVGNIKTFGNIFLQSNSNGFRTIALDTTNGADNQELYLCGGATASSSRGAQVGVYGNEVSGTGGSVVIVAGNVSTGDIDFLTANTQRMIINNSGNVGIGTDLPNAKLHSRVGVSGASVWLPSLTPMVLESNSTVALNFLSPNTGEAYIMFSRPNNTTAGYMFYNHATDVFSFSRSLSLSNGITFNGLLQQNAQSVVLSNNAYSNAAAVQAYATNTANVYPGYGFHKASNLGGFLYATSRTELRYRGDGGTDKVLLMADSDYEEGTFTVRLQGSGGQPAHGIQAGFYTKVGNVVTCVGTYTWNSSGSNANTTTKLEGFPFVNSSTSNARAVGSLGAVNGIAQGATLRLVIDPGHAGAYIIQQNSNNYSHNNTISASGAIYGFELTYRTN